MYPIRPVLITITNDIRKTKPRPDQNSNSWFAKRFKSPGLGRFAALDTELGFTLNMPKAT